MGASEDSSDDVPAVCQIEEAASTIAQPLDRRGDRRGVSGARACSAECSFANRSRVSTPCRRAVSDRRADGRAQRQCRDGLVRVVRSHERHGRDGSRRRLGPPVGFADQERQGHLRRPSRRGLGGAVFARRRVAGDGRRRRLAQNLEAGRAAAAARSSSIATRSAAWPLRTTARCCSPATARAGCTSGRSTRTKPLAEAKQPGAVYAVAISPDDETLATAGSDKIVRLWNAKTLTQKLPLEGHAGPVYGLVQSRRTATRLGRLGQDRAHLGCRQRPARQIVGRPRRRYLGRRLFARRHQARHRRHRRRRETVERRDGQAARDLSRPQDRRSTPSPSTTTARCSPPAAATARCAVWPAP